MEHWEYKYLSFGGVFREAPAEEVENQLNELGREGWEAVGISHGKDGRLWILLKRQVALEVRKGRAFWAYW